MTKEAVNVPPKKAEVTQVSNPISGLRQEINHLFDNFMTGWPILRSMEKEPLISFPGTQFALSPKVDVSETDSAYEITAELPGMNEKDIELILKNDMLILKGEKKEAREEKKKDYHLSERSYGSFQRSFRIPDDVDAAKISSQFSKGVLTVSLPKSTEAKVNTRKIEIKTA